MLWLPLVAKKINAFSLMMLFFHLPIIIYCTICLHRNSGSLQNRWASSWFGVRLFVRSTESGESFSTLSQHPFSPKMVSIQSPLRFGDVNHTNVCYSLSALGNKQSHYCLSYCCRAASGFIWERRTREQHGERQSQVTSVGVDICAHTHISQTLY